MITVEYPDREAFLSDLGALGSAWAGFSYSAFVEWRQALSWVAYDMDEHEYEDELPLDVVFPEYDYREDTPLLDAIRAARSFSWRARRA